MEGGPAGPAQAPAAPTAPGQDRSPRGPCAGRSLSSSPCEVLGPVLGISDPGRRGSWPVRAAAEAERPGEGGQNAGPCGRGGRPAGAGVWAESRDKAACGRRQRPQAWEGTEASRSLGQDVRQRRKADIVGEGVCRRAGRGMGRPRPLQGAAASPRPAGDA